MQICKKNTKKGFTLIELMLAVAFLGTLLLSVAMLAMRLVDMYTKGATMRAVNSVGGAIVDDVRTHVTSSNLWTENLKDGFKTKDEYDASRKQYYRTHTYTVGDGVLEPKETFVDYGAFCTNSYTYIFNYQTAMLKYRDSKNKSDTESYLMVGTETDHRPYALVRIKDTGCTQFKLLGMTEAEVNAYNDAVTDEANKLPAYSSHYMQGENHYFKVDNMKGVTVLLDGSTSDEGTDLQLYDFAVMSATQSHVTNQVIYDIAFVLGTTRGGINVNSSNNYCTKEVAKSNQGVSNAEDFADHAISYCSVNRFDFVVRQTGGKE